MQRARTPSLSRCCVRVSTKAILLHTVVFCALVVIHGRAQEPAVTTVEGTVWQAGSRVPLSGAAVSLVAGTSVLATVRSNQQGQFAFVGVAVPCNCAVRATKAGHFDAVLGQNGEGTTPTRLALVAKQPMVGVDVWLTPHAVVSGRVRDVRGQPVVRAPVRLIERVSSRGRDFVVGGAVTATDDNGDFTFSALKGGRYVVQLITAGLGAGRYSDEFYPGVPSLLAAGGIDLAPGERIDHLELIARTSKTYRLSGFVQGTFGVGERTVVRLVGEGAEDLVGAAATTPVGQGGVFTFDAVPPGRYVLIVGQTTAGLEDQAAMMTAATMPRPLGEGPTGFVSASARTVAPALRIREWALTGSQRTHGRMDVEVVDREVVGIVLPSQQLPSVSGIVTWDNGEPVDPLALGSVRLESVERSPTLGVPQGSLSAAGAAASFALRGVQPGRYVVRVGEQFRVKSVSLGGQELRDDVLTVGDEALNGVRIVLANELATLSGTVSGGRDDAPSRVLVLPATEALWSAQAWSGPHVRLTRTALNNTFHVTALPAGDYLVVAVPDGDAERWRDDAFVEHLRPFATRITISWGESRHVQVRLAPPR